MTCSVQTRYTLPCVVEGDTWAGIDLMQFKIAGAAPPYPLHEVALKFKHYPDSPGESLATLSNTNQKISIVDAALWKITIPPQVLDLIDGTFYYDLRTTNTQGKISTYIHGTILVRPTVQ